MFEHSVKVPRHYKVAANIFKKVSTEGGSVKTLLYDNKLRHFRTNVLYALITETIKHAVDVNKLFENCSILKNEPRLDPWLAKVLTTELLFGKKALPGKSKPEQTILSYKEQFEKYATAHEDDLKTEVIRRPRYVRINTNLFTTSDAIRAFQEEGYRFIRCTSGPYNDYLHQVQGLTDEDFTQDYHVKTVFVFASGTKLHEHELYLENKIILQDKATSMAVHLLAPPPGSVVLDMCAAPGMKTTQLAAYMRNQGKIYAIERNEKRYQTLRDFIDKTGSKCAEPIHKDALEIRRGEYDDVEYILLDPSCSGSGMELSVHNYIDATRLAKLTSLQEKFLKHAMNSFPKAKRIVYSTCSLFPEENERVITNAVKTSRAKWRVQDVKEILKGQWNNIGSGMYGSMGTRCIYAKPETDFTTGFFVAVLDRDQKDFEKGNKEINGENKLTKCKLNNEEHDKEEICNDVIKKRKIKGYINESHYEDRSEVSIEEKGRKKKKRDKQPENIDSVEKNDDVLDETSIVSNEQLKKKKKHKENCIKDVHTEIDIEKIDTILEPEVVNKVNRKKAKKRKKEGESNDSHVVQEESVDTSNEALRQKKKKRAKNLEYGLDDTVDSELSERREKKKKRNKNKAKDME